MGNIDGQGTDLFDLGPFDLTAAGKTPGSIGDHPDAEPESSGLVQRPDPAIFDLDIFVFFLNDPDIGVTGPAGSGRIQSEMNKIFHVYLPKT